jgi:type II secretory pathway component GspD/PulD (secretin)
MSTFATIVACIAMAVPALAQEPNSTSLPTVTVSAKGSDVRAVLHELFEQQKKSYVLDPSVKFSLYLSLNEIEFEEALIVVCKAASLKYELQNGIYYINKGTLKPETNPVKPTTDAKPTIKPVETKTAPERPRGILPGSVFQKRVTTRFNKIDIRELFAEISKQTGVEIEIDKSVPNYKLDAFLIDTSLKYAIDQINAGAGLEYKLTNFKSILIFMPKKEDQTRIQVIKEENKS